MFDPKPMAILDAAGSMRMGDVARQVLLFRERFWPGLKVDKMTSEVREKLGKLSFLYSFREVPPVWWTQFPELSPILTAWTGGPRSERLIAMSPDQTLELLVRQLGRIFGRAEFGGSKADIRRDVLHLGMHDWRNDVLSLGAYSYVPARAAEASGFMSEPVEETLYFAGEHTDTTGHWGTVHGAMRSGMRAAHQILTTRTS